jgi:hypothetical protein
MGGSNSTPKPRGWEEIVSEELEGVSDGGCPTTKKKVVVPYPDDKVRNLGVTSNDWDDILEEFNNGMAGYWSSAAHTGPLALIFLVSFAVGILAFSGVLGEGEGNRRLEEGGDCGEDCDEDGEMPSYLIPPAVALFVMFAVQVGMKLQNKKHDGKLHNLLTEKVNSRFEAKGLLVRLHVQVTSSSGPGDRDRRENIHRFFCAYIRAAPSTATTVTAGMMQPRTAMAQAQPMQIQQTMQSLQVTVPAGAAGGQMIQVDVNGTPMQVQVRLRQAREHE